MFKQFGYRYLILLADPLHFVGRKKLHFLKKNVIVQFLLDATTCLVGNLTSLSGRQYAKFWFDALLHLIYLINYNGNQIINTNFY